MSFLFNSPVLNIVKQWNTFIIKDLNTIPIEYENTWFQYLLSSGLVQ